MPIKVSATRRGEGSTCTLYGWYDEAAKLMLVRIPEDQPGLGINDRQELQAAFRPDFPSLQLVAGMHDLAFDLSSAVYPQPNSVLRLFAEWYLRQFSVEPPLLKEVKVHCWLPGEKYFRKFTEITVVKRNFGDAYGLMAFTPECFIQPHLDAVCQQALIRMGTVGFVLRATPLGVAITQLSD